MEVKKNNNIEQLSEMCQHKDDPIIINHCKSKISRLLQDELLSSNLPIQDIIDRINTNAFKTDDLIIVHNKLVEIRDTNEIDLTQKLDYETNPLVIKYIETKISEVFNDISPDESKKSLVERQRASLEAAERQAEEDFRKALELSEAEAASSKLIGESKTSGESKSVNLSFDMPTNLEGIIEMLNNEFIELSKQITSCSSKIFNDWSLTSQKIYTAGNSTRPPIVAPYKRTESQYKTLRDFGLIIYNGGYHNIGVKGNQYNLNFYFRHYLFSAISFHGLPHIKPMDNLTKWIKFNGIRILFETDVVFDKFYNYVMNDNNESIKAIKHLAMIYQQLKIAEEKYPDEMIQFRIVLDSLAFCICSLIFIIFKSLNDNDLLKLPNVDRRFNIDSIYSQTFDIYSLVQTDCKELFHESDSKLYKILALLKESYTYLPEEVNNPFTN